MDYTGNIFKMKSRLANPVQYTLRIGGGEVNANSLLGRQVRIDYLNKINCIACGRETKTSFFQGYCYPCFATLPDTDSCVMNPETCRAHEGISRDMKWSESHCLVDHIVYLALTSSVKVGVTRESQGPFRWIDQGAWKVIKLARTPNRHLAGLIEVSLKYFYTDKTSWQKMLKDERNEEASLLDEKEKAWNLLDPELQEYVIEDDEITEIKYPVDISPASVKSVSFDKTSSVEGILTGIKGQYLIFDNNQVINIRRHNGYLVRFMVF